ncbi:hypothetical protein HYX16_06690 [Candidatus Woesearchaeota archaeon]|nr:hypothetical protein [Candidatus Woesearchaeota archaeon]
MEPDDRWAYEDKLIDIVLEMINFGRFFIDIKRHEESYPIDEDDKIEAAEMGISVEEYIGQHSLPNMVGFYKLGRKIGELRYYTEPINAVSLSDEFKPYATILERLLGVKLD